MEIYRLPESRTKASELIKQLQEIITKHGDLEIAIMVDDEIRSEELQIDDVTVSIFRQIVTLNNRLLERRFIGIVGTMRPTQHEGVEHE